MKIPLIKGTSCSLSTIWSSYLVTCIFLWKLFRLFSMIRFKMQLQRSGWELGLAPQSPAEMTKMKVFQYCLFKMKSCSKNKLITKKTSKMLQFLHYLSLRRINDWKSISKNTNKNIIILIGIQCSVKTHYNLICRIIYIIIFKKNFYPRWEYCVPCDLS